MHKTMINKIFAFVVILVVLATTFAIPCFAYGGYKASGSDFTMPQDFLTPGIPFNFITKNDRTSSIWIFNDIFDTVAEGGGMSMQNNMLTTWRYSTDECGITLQSPSHNYPHDTVVPLPENYYQTTIINFELPDDVFGVQTEPVEDQAEPVDDPIDPGDAPIVDLSDPEVFETIPVDEDTLHRQSNAELWATDFVYDKKTLANTSLRYSYRVRYDSSLNMRSLGCGIMGVIRPFNRSDDRYNIRIEAYMDYGLPSSPEILVECELPCSGLTQVIETEFERAEYDLQEQYFIEYFEVFPVFVNTSGQYYRIGNAFHTYGDVWRVRGCIPRSTFDEIQIYYDHDMLVPTNVNFGDPIKNAVNSILKIRLFELPIAEGTVAVSLGSIILLIFTFAFITIIIKWIS